MVDSVIDGARLSAGFSQLTSLATATGVNAPKEAKAAIIQAETQNIRWRDDGTAPTASVGMQLASGSSFLFTGNLQALQIIEETASAKANISFYK